MQYSSVVRKNRCIQTVSAAFIPKIQFLLPVFWRSLPDISLRVTTFDRYSERLPKRIDFVWFLWKTGRIAWRQSPASVFETELFFLFSVMNSKYSNNIDNSVDLCDNYT